MLKPSKFIILLSDKTIEKQWHILQIAACVPESMHFLLKKIILLIIQLACIGDLISCKHRSCNIALKQNVNIKWKQEIFHLYQSPKICFI